MNDETAPTMTATKNSNSGDCCCVTNIRQVLLASTRQEMFRKVRDNGRGAVAAAKSWPLLVGCFLFLAIGLLRQIPAADGASHESFARPEQSSSPISSSSSLSERLLVKRASAHHSLPQQHWRLLEDVRDISKASFPHQQTQEILGSKRNHKRIKHKLRSPVALKEQSESAQPQVPEQLPVVVSSSDNSYVSASPIVLDAQTTSKIVSETTTTTTLVVDNEPLAGRHWTHSSGSSFMSSSRSRRLLKNHANTNELDESSENHKFSQWHTLWPTDFTSRTSDQVDKMSSTSDIPTTATTTQRTVQLANSPLEGESTSQVDHNESPQAQSLVSRFKIKPATIINTGESIASGGAFINYTYVTNFNACLVECWITDSCDTAVYRESTNASPFHRRHSEWNQVEQQYAIENIRHLDRRKYFKRGSEEYKNYHVCFLFECVKSNKFRCRFSAHSDYVSSLLLRKVRAASGDGIEVEEEEEEEVERDDAEILLRDNNKYSIWQGAKSSDKTKSSSGSSNSVPSDEVSVGEIDYPFLTKDATLVEDQETISDSDDDDDNNDKTSPQMDSIPSNSVNRHYTWIDKDEKGQSRKLEPVVHPVSEMHYSRIIDSRSRHGHSLNGRGGAWHDTHIASIRIGEYEDYGKGSLNGALIAIVFGVAISAMLIMIVGHKLRSIRKRVAYKSRRQSLVPVKEPFINTMPI